MMISLINKKGLALFLMLTCLVVCAQAQTVVKGFVKDAQTHAPLAFVSVYFKGSKGVVSGEDGSYSISTNNPKNTTLEFSEGLNGKGFYFNNPNASRSCACGESFAV